MKHPVFFGMACVLAWGLAASGPAQASSPAEKIVCTAAPRADWLPEARIREIFGVKDFTLVKFKVSRGHCYEFYAVHRDGSLVEAYYDPVSGRPVRYHRIPPVETTAAPTR